ncbi:hypothetical protein Tsubulata_041990 [Turnera subulata]|uniref:Wax synthase domain-containing protein n=1 Tax=Turnera subulata TaxID=218843 RepID=A0A9Q0FRW7_9ROSI|nr:hypothetical protein Tsubulata_041990 [Turnera subulata]
MEGEKLNFIKVWVSVFISLSYCYAIRNKAPKGTKRLLLLLPVICFFLYLPLNLSTVHLCGNTAFFVSWLANFKLLLFAFGKGPLSSDPSISLPLFIALSSLPIRLIQKNPPPKPNPRPPANNKNEYGAHQKLSYVIKGLIVALMVRVYDYKDEIPLGVILVLYAFHVYFMLEIILAVAAWVARTVLGVELEPQFNEPYLATSLQDFWGKRWNLMVTRILRPTVYEPTLHAITMVTGNREWAPLPAVFATFVASAVMHELIFYYICRAPPTWEITWFFLLHGACLTAEIALKKASKGRWQLPRVLSRALTVVFVMVTALWLFFPKFVKGKIDVRAFEEYAALSAFARDLGWRIMHVFGR